MKLQITVVCQTKESIWSKEFSCLINQISPKYFAAKPEINVDQGRFLGKPETNMTHNIAASIVNEWLDFHLSPIDFVPERISDITPNVTGFY